MASTLAALGLFLFARLDFGVSLKDLSAAALPYEQVCLFYSFNSLFNINFALIHFSTFCCDSFYRIYNS